jgi:hypothetical protein
MAKEQYTLTKAFEPQPMRVDHRSKCIMHSQSVSKHEHTSTHAKANTMKFNEISTVFKAE